MLAANGGTSTAESLISAYNKAAENMSQEDAEVFATKLANTNWNELGSIENFKEEIKALGLEITDTELDTFCMQLADLN